MSSAVDIEAFRELERRRLRALVEGDMVSCHMLHSDDYQLIRPGGAASSKEDHLGAIASGELRYLAFEPSTEIAVRIRGDMAVRYRVRIEVEYPGGRDDDLFWHTDIYELNQGQWQAVWSHATRIKPGN
jgi:hypothetical protein